MEIVGYNKLTNKKTHFGTYPEQPIPHKGEAIYLPNGACVECMAVLYDYGKNEIHLHYAN
jgi:hypothetical protein